MPSQAVGLAKLVELARADAALTTPIPMSHRRDAGRETTIDTGEYPSSDVRLMARRLAERALDFPQVNARYDCFRSRR